MHASLDALVIGLYVRIDDFLLGLPPEGPDPLVGTMKDWLGGHRPVSVLDFNGVPSEAAQAAIGVVLSLLFEVAIRSPQAGPGVGRPSPVLVVLEEAHRYLNEDRTELARDSANRIAGEGRRYGIGLMLVTQWPSELPDTTLAQCGSVISLRLSNQGDHAKIRAALPDSPSGLASVLPSLRTGEAILSGEAVSCRRESSCVAPRRFPKRRTHPLRRGVSQRPLPFSTRRQLRGGRRTPNES